MKLKRISPYLLLICLCFCGCYAINNIDQLSLLGQYSREKDDQHHLVKTINDHYDALTKVIAEGRIRDYKDKSSFLSSFGVPISEKELSDGREQWLYRHAIFRLAKDKVYVYFDRSGKMIKWEKVPCSLSL